MARDVVIRSRTRLWQMAAALVAAAALGCADPAPRAPLVVCFGDSTTLWRGESLNWTALVADALAVDHPDLQVVNAGVSSETTRAALGRFYFEVLRREPDVVTLLYGINDSRSKDANPEAPPQVELDRYARHLEHMVDRLEARGTHVVLLTPNPIDPGGTRLEAYAEAVRALARDRGVALVDLHEAFSRAPGGAEALLMDGTHANDAGHRSVAALAVPAIEAALSGSKPR